MPGQPKAILVGVRWETTGANEFAASLVELRRLVETLGYDPLPAVSQRRSSAAAATLIGQGKLDELKQQVQATRAACVVFDQELSSTQLRNVEESLGVRVLDRTGLILEIFSRHARSREAQLQVEVARLKYQLSRVRASAPRERQGSGIGARGAGEAAIELERRRLRDRIAHLQREITSIGKNRTRRREQREEQPVVALVGYTNAGKSSWMRALTGGEVVVADRLFATLDTTVRAMQPEAFPRVLVSDTVGFLNQLPHDLVASFHSTLEEATSASLLLHIVDASDPAFRRQMRVTRQVLDEVGAAGLPLLVVLNKVDLLKGAEKKRLRLEFRDAVLLSAREKDDVAALRAKLLDIFTRDLATAELSIPYEKAGVLGEIRHRSLVLDERYENDRVIVHVKSTAASLDRLRALLAA